MRLQSVFPQPCPAALPGAGRMAHLWQTWTGAQFVQSDALIFVGAAGIAVRAIAPHCKSKTTDPAVVVVDECGRFAVPILSGHLGGANDLARAIAAVCGAVPVITTATDAHGIFAADEWAKHQNCMVLEPERIKLVSGKLLAGQPVYYRADFPVTGTVPSGLFPADSPGKSRLCTHPLPHWAGAASCAAHRGAGHRLQAGHKRRQRWKPLLPSSAPGMALLRRQLPPPQAST